MNETIIDGSRPDVYYSGFQLYKLGDRSLLIFSSSYVRDITDDLFNITKKIKPIVGFEDIVIHGTPNYVKDISNNGTEVKYSAKQFADILRNDTKYHKGNIRLISCNSGRLDEGFAQQLANELNVKVIAPTEVVWVNKIDGDLFISDNEVLARLWEEDKNVNQTGVWKLFEPRKE